MDKLGKLLLDNLSFILVVCAMFCFVYAAYLFATIAAFIVGGACLGLLAFICQPDERR